MIRRMNGPIQPATRCRSGVRAAAGRPIQAGVQPPQRRPDAQGPKVSALPSVRIQERRPEAS